MPHEKASGVRMIDISEFNERCLILVDEVVCDGKEIVVTRNGHPICRLVPFRRKPKSLFGIDKGRFELLGDLISPIDVDWEAQTGRTRDED